MKRLVTTTSAATDDYWFVAEGRLGETTEIARCGMTGKKCRKGVLVLATTAAMGLAAGSNLAEVSVNSLNRLAIQLAEAVSAVASANRQSPEEFRLGAILLGAGATGEAVVDVPVEKVNGVVRRELELLVAQDELPRARTDLPHL
jgi:hypothetical protein